MVPNNLMITPCIVNCRSAAFVGQTSVQYASSPRAVAPPPNLPTATLHISKETYRLSHNRRHQQPADSNRSHQLEHAAN